MMRIRLPFVFLLMFMVYSCSRKNHDDGASIDLGYNYFPVQTGATWIYRVDSIGYDDNSGHTIIDSSRYEYMEQITGTFMDVSGKTGQYVTRSYRMSDTDDWVPAHTWAILKTELNAQKVEENIRYVKLVFPLAADKKWNGNLYNNLGDEQYAVEFYDQPFSPGALSFGQTLKVVQRDEENAIEEIKRYEVYARNTGLVYLLSDSINTQVSGSRGYRFRLTLTSYTP